MKKLLASLCSFIGAITVVSCQTLQESPSSRESWSTNMLQISQSFSNLFPFAWSPVAFYDPKNEAAIKQNIEAISENAADIRHDKSAPDQDPSLQFSAEQFADQMRLIQHQWKIGNKQYVRFALRSTIDYCISCHTRSAQGPHNLNLPWAVKDKQLPLMGRFQYSLAMRQYEEFKALFPQVVNDSEAFKNNPREWMMAVKSAIAVAVRVDRNRALALQWANKVIESQVSPVYFKNQAFQWKQDFLQWNVPDTASWTRHQHFEEAEQLITMTRKRQEPRNNFIPNLRASYHLHQVLKNHKKDQLYVQALYAAGRVSEELKDLSLWHLHESYYRSCIELLPHSMLARRCYLRYENSVLSSEGDGELSDYRRKELDRLKELSTKADAGLNSHKDIWRQFDSYDSSKNRVRQRVDR